MLRRLTALLLTAVLLLSALVTGLFTGLCAQLVLKRLRRGAGRKEKGEST